MAIRFHKSIKIAPGVKVNLNKKSASVTVGGKGVHKTVSTTGRTTTSIGIPGSGLYYTDTKSPKKPEKKTPSASDHKQKQKTSQKAGTQTHQNKSMDQTEILSEKLSRKYSVRAIKIFRIIFIILGIVFGMLGIAMFSASLISAVVMIFLAVFMFSMARSYKKVIRYLNDEE